MHRHLKPIIFILAVVLLLGVLFACTPVEPDYSDPYPIVDGTQNDNYKDFTTKEQAIDKAVGSLENLLAHLDSDVVTDTGYYLGADMLINTDNGSAFRLRLEANLYTYPHEIKDANGNKILGEDGLPLVDPVALAKHNDIIRYSDIVLEWFDGATNEMLIGFYFDGINPNSVDDGNDLYLNLQGSKRIFKDFGNSVIYQQFIRLITQFNLETMIATEDDKGNVSSSATMDTLREALTLAVTNNYKQTLNGDNTTIFFNSLPLGTVVDTITEFMQSIFAPFEDKLDPLSNKYLGFLFSTLGKASFTSMNADMEFISTPNENLGKDILRQLVVDASGDTSVPVHNKQTGLTTIETIPYQAHISAEYDVRTSPNIVFDKEGYTLYSYGDYEYTGDMFIPMLDLKLDVLLRTDMNEVDNTTNKIFMNCRDIATDDLIIGMYYTVPSEKDKLSKINPETGLAEPVPLDEALTFIDIQGLQHLYGGIAFEDIGLPKAYKGGFDLANVLSMLFDFIDEYAVIAVDNILYGNPNPDEESKFAEITGTIMDNVTSTMKDEDDPSSRATIKIRITLELIRKIMTVSDPNGTVITADSMVQLIQDNFGFNLQEIATILNISLEDLIEKTFFDVTYDVDEYSIKLEVFTEAYMSEEEAEENGPSLVLRMDLYPNHIGEEVRIVFPSFHDFNELQDVMTYSGSLDGQFIFATAEEVDLSDLLGSFMGDMSGLNTPFILPASANIHFHIDYDQYIREQVLPNGRWTRSARSAFKINFYYVTLDTNTGESKEVDIITIIANDVSFSSEVPVEELGYVWLDYHCVENMPMFKVREDIFIRGFYEYMGETELEDYSPAGITKLVMNLTEDSFLMFEPDVIRITTSNQYVKDIFRVDELIGTIEARIGFKQRVHNIDHEEVKYAMYTVGDLDPITGENAESVYSTKLHETIKVYFDFGDRIEERDFRFLYDPETIKVVNGETYYMPAINDLFMGVTRDYLVNISTDIGKQGINSLVDDYYVWEPLDDVPTTVSAYYGDADLRHNYDAEFRLHAVYDKDTGYYTVINDLGYEIIYDFENNLYVIGLGSQLKHTKAVEQVINKDVPYYYQTYTNDAGRTFTYDLGMRKKGWFIVEHPTYKVLYNQDRDVYVVETQAILEELKAQKFFGENEPNEETGYVPPKVYPLSYETQKGITFKYDLDSGMFCKQLPRGDGTNYVVLYDYDENYFYASTFAEALQLQSPSLLGETRVGYTQNYDFTKEYDWAGDDYTKADWKNTIFHSFNWTNNMTWDDVTLNGGKFVVYVVIGEGMMATYRENVVVKILNREIETDKYVNVNTESGLVKAPVADGITIDPYAYLIYKAFFMNSGMVSEQELMQGFVNWYFKKYEVTFQFTKFYNDPEEDTPDEVGFFDWSFCYPNDRAIYKEEHINNRHSGSSSNPDYLESNITYLHTVFHGQVIAISVEVLPRTLESVWVIGQDNHNEYVVDALKPDTYTIPTDLVYFFKGQDGEEYVLNLKDYNYTVDDIPSLFSTLPATFDRYALEFEGQNFQKLLEGPDALKVIKWNHPVANNVKLEGNEYPFLETAGATIKNVTTSNFDLANYFDHNRAWYLNGEHDEGWFFIEEVALTVRVPDKVIGEHDYTFKTGDDFHDQTEKVMNIQVAPYYTPGQVTIGDNWGVYYVDPYDSNTWILPKEIYVHFDGTVTGTFDPYFDTVEWSNVEGDDIVHFDASTGEYRLIVDPTLVANYYFLEASIGEGENTMKVRILVQHMTGVAEDITFKMVDGSLADGNLTYADVLQQYLTSTDTPQSEYQLKSYLWAVDTYARFQVPEVLDIVFADGTNRIYPASWHDHAPWVQGTTVTLSTTLGDIHSYHKDMMLTYSIEAKTVEDLLFNLWEEDTRDAKMPSGINITVDTFNNYVVLSGVQLNRAGLIALKDGTGISPYDFFNWLFSDITVVFSESDKANLRVTDATTSASLPIFGTLDTQKLIEAWTGTYGQGVDIYVGQDDDAHDFTIRFLLEMTEQDKPSIDFDEDQSQIVLEAIELEIYNADNTFKYEGGYVLQDQLQFTITRADGTTVRYGGSGATVPAVWTVAFPTQEAEDAFFSASTDRMVEVYKYEQLSVISEERLKLGGKIWLSTMLHDSSRVYVEISSSVYEIGSNFHSADDDASPYTISYGTLIIDNLYDNYPLISFLRSERLPSKIKVGDPSSTLVKNNILWTLADGVEAELSAIDYRGTSVYPGGEIDLATSIIMGKPVTLKLKVLPTEVVQIAYEVEDVDVSLHFTSRVKQSYSSTSIYHPYGEVIVVDIDAYHNWAYGGNFLVPSNINLVYNALDRTLDLNDDGVIDPGYPDKYNYGRGLYFYYDPACRNEHLISQIEYDLNGHKWVGQGRISDRDVLAYAKLSDGQTIIVIFHFLDKTVESINAGQQDDSVLILDPYTEDNITVPNKVTINFTEGEPLEYTTNWNVPENFEVMYDTFQTILGGDHNNFFSFISTLSGYEGMASQELLLKVKVADRLFESYQLVNGVVDYYDSYENPNAYYRYTDPFAGRASDLPEIVISADSFDGQDFNLIWQFTDSQITVAGTVDESGLVPIYVRGHIYNVDRGQPVVIKVYVDRWDHKAVRRPSANGDYIIMEGDAMRFVISAITGVSSIDHYKVDFEITASSPEGNLEKTMVSKIFVPEGISPEKIDPSYDDSYEYRMIWDRDALNRAQGEGEATGYFILANSVSATKFQLVPAIYQYENPSILQIDLGYGMGTQNNAIFVVNPLNPKWVNPDTGDSTVSAIGTYNTEYAISYDEQGLVTTVIWDGVNSLNLSHALLGGGIIRNWTVILELTSIHDPSFSYSQTFDIVLVALDISPISYINSSSPAVNTLTEAPYKSVYNATTYAGASNPYKDLYSRLINTQVDRDGEKRNVLDTAVNDLGMVGGRHTYRVESWEEDVYISNNTKTQYSKTVRIDGRVYNTNIVKRVWNQVFEITGLDVGYGKGTDQVRIEAFGLNEAPIIMVLNPLEPIFGTPVDGDKYVTQIDKANVYGYYNGNDISAENFTYTLTWWDRATGGDTLILGQDQFVGGGVIDYWKVIVKVYDGANVIYEQIVNVRLVLLDMSPNKTTFYNASDNAVASGVKISYAINDYNDKVNPYGSLYTASLINALNDGIANEGITDTTSYLYRIVEWGEYSVCNSIDEDGDHRCDNCNNLIEAGKTKTIRNSVKVEVYVEGEVTPLITIYTDLFQTVLIS